MKKVGILLMVFVIFSVLFSFSVSASCIDSDEGKCTDFPEKKQEFKLFNFIKSFFGIDLVLFSGECDYGSCDDGDVCTEDFCQDGVCINRNIPGGGECTTQTDCKSVGVCDSSRIVQSEESPCFEGVCPSSSSPSSPTTGSVISETTEANSCGWFCNILNNIPIISNFFGSSSSQNQQASAAASGAACTDGTCNENLECETDCSPVVCGTDGLPSQESSCARTLTITPLVPEDSININLAKLNEIEMRDSISENNLDKILEIDIFLDMPGITTEEKNVANKLLASLYFDNAQNSELESIWTIGPPNDYLNLVPDEGIQVFYIKGELDARGKEIVTGWSPNGFTYLPFTQMTIKNEDMRFGKEVRGKTLNYIFYNPLFKNLITAKYSTNILLAGGYNVGISGFLVRSNQDYSIKQHNYIKARDIYKELKDQAILDGDIDFAIEISFLLALVYVELQDVDATETYAQFTNALHEYEYILNSTSSNEIKAQAYLGLAGLEIRKGKFYNEDAPTLSVALKYLKLSLRENSDYEDARFIQANLKKEILDGITRGYFNMNKYQVGEIEKYSSNGWGCFLAVGRMCPINSLNDLVRELNIEVTGEILSEWRGVWFLKSLHDSGYDSGFNLYDYFYADVSRQKRMIVAVQEQEDIWVCDAELAVWVGGNEAKLSNWGSNIGEILGTPEKREAVRLAYIKNHINDGLEYDSNAEERSSILYEDYFVNVHIIQTDINSALCKTPDIALLASNGNKAEAQIIINDICGSSSDVVAVNYFRYKTGAGYEFDSIKDVWYDGIVNSINPYLPLMLLPGSVLRYGSKIKNIVPVIRNGKGLMTLKSLVSGSSKYVFNLLSTKNIIFACKQITSVSGKAIIKGSYNSVKVIGGKIYNFLISIAPSALSETVATVAATVLVGPEAGELVGIIGLSDLPLSNSIKHLAKIDYIFIDTSGKLYTQINLPVGRKMEALSNLIDLMDPNINVNGDIVEHMTIDSFGNPITRKFALTEGGNLKPLRKKTPIRGKIPWPEVKAIRDYNVEESVADHFIHEVIQSPNSAKRKKISEQLIESYKTPRANEGIYQERGKYLMSEVTGKKMIDWPNDPSKRVKELYIPTSDGGIKVTMSRFKSPLSDEIAKLLGIPEGKVIEAGWFASRIKIGSADLNGLFYKHMLEAKALGIDKIVAMTSRVDQRTYKMILREHARSIKDLPEFTNTNKDNFIQALGLLDNKAVKKNDLYETWLEEGLNLDKPGKGDCKLHEGELWGVMNPVALKSDVSEEFYREFVGQYGTHPAILEASITIMDVNDAALKRLKDKIEGGLAKKIR